MEIGRDPALSYDETTPFLLSPKVGQDLNYHHHNRTGLEEVLSNGTVPQSLTG